MMNFDKSFSLIYIQLANKIIQSLSSSFIPLMNELGIIVAIRTITPAHEHFQLFIKQNYL
jgi:hypothetical protein